MTNSWDVSHSSTDGIDERNSVIIIFLFDILLPAFERKKLLHNRVLFANLI